MADSGQAWKTGDHLTHRFNPELGIGHVTAVEGRALIVNFPRTGATLRIAASSDALTRVESDATEPVARSPVVIQAADADALRDDIRRLRSIREDDVLGSFLGGRVRLFPHQLYVAERATASDPVRWLLADEVGLGKTIEACLILNRLVHTRKIERCLVVVPEALTVQWLGELWRKYHQVLSLIHI